jgi:hypothetical protein
MQRQSGALRPARDLKIDEKRVLFVCHIGWLGSIDRTGGARHRSFRRPLAWLTIYFPRTE